MDSDDDNYPSEESEPESDDQYPGDIDFNPDTADSQTVIREREEKSWCAMPGVYTVP